MTLEGYRGNGL